MTSEGIADITGSFGRWQKRIFAAFFYVAIVGMWQNFAITFLAPNMEYHCVNSTERCLVQEGNHSLPCTEWEYNTSYFSHTIINEWNLVCDREWLVSLAKSVYMVGFLLSVIIFGQISDWIGRRPVIVICYLIAVISMHMSLLSSSYLMFVILRFFQAFGRTGFSTTGFVLLMEIVGEEHRTQVGVNIQYGFALGFVSLTGIAFLFRDWFWLQLVMSLPLLPAALAFSWIPESPRWLLMKGKTKQLEKLLKRACQINGKELRVCAGTCAVLQNVPQDKTNSVLDLFKTPRLRRRILCMIYIWFVNAFMYYALSYNTNDLAGNPYITFLIAGLLEFPSYIILYWVIEKFGRRPSLIAFMVVGAIACTAIAIAPSSMPWMSTSLAMIGKFCITASFGLVYIYTSECFPTVVRNVAIGSCSMWARVGSILAPFVKELGVATYPWLPSVVYGFLALSSSLLALLLPETKGRKIPDTLEEGEWFAQPTKKDVSTYITLKETHST